ncbi:unnamed protein product [Rotaria magnacalcarata]|uniref:Uncharacterized protein n=1 Tax=Rotaria magnacalcarata TaxID=392030 RepID=A0A8S2STP5_9BILA|nr:unnamed protein product [Rotaria magnacalcarata]
MVLHLLFFVVVIPQISADAHWSQEGMVVAGSIEDSGEDSSGDSDENNYPLRHGVLYRGRHHGQCEEDGIQQVETIIAATNRLASPHGLVIDDKNQTIIIADQSNHRIIEWKIGDTNGQVVAGGKGKGYGLNQLNSPTDVLIDKETNSLIICNYGSRQVVRWLRRAGTKRGEILIGDIACWGLAIDDHRNLYVSDIDNDIVLRYSLEDIKNGTVVAGRNGPSNDLRSLCNPTYLCVDQQQAVYVSDTENNRVMKWNKDAQEGVCIAGDELEGSSPNQLSHPGGIFVDTLGTLYVADTQNGRIMRWPQNKPQGTTIVGNGDPLHSPIGLSFDQDGNLYVTHSQGVQRFDIE